MSRLLTKRKARQEGAVLIIVLWIIMLLTFLLAAHTNNVKTETRIVRDGIEQIRLRAAAEGVINYLSLVHTQSGQGLIEKSGQTSKLEIGSQAILYRVVPEAAFVSMNAASSDLLEQLLSALAENGEDTESLAAAIIDWRDPDNIVSPNGAEAEEYESFGFDYVPRDGPFQSLEELGRVKGMSRSLLEKLEPYVSVFSNSPVVDLKFAPEQLLEIFDGTLNESEVEQVSEVDSATPAGITFDNYQSGVISDTGIYRIQVELADQHNSMRQQMEITVSFPAAAGSKPYMIKKWNPYTARFTLAENQEIN